MTKVARKGVLIYELNLSEFIMSLIKYFQETKAELKFVKWPGQRQTLIYTALVIFISIITAVYLGVFDFIFTSGINKLIF